MFVQNSSNVTLSAFHIQHKKALSNFITVSSPQPAMSESLSNMCNEDNGNDPIAQFHPSTITLR